MPKYIDTHPMGKIDAATLKKLQSAPKDQFGVTHHDILYNEAEDRVYCVLDAPSADAVEKHHEHAGLKCEWVHEVKSTRV
jgi:hypothetical protein